MALRLQKTFTMRASFNLIIVMFILSFGGAVSQAQRAERLLMSLDIDWVLFYQIQPGQPMPTGEHYIVEGKTYVPTPFLREVVSTLLMHQIDIGFISGGDESRNLELLGKLKYSTGVSLADLAKKILSSHQLHKVEGADPKDFFSNRFKKDLSRYGVPEANIAHVDDLIFFTFNELQARSFIHLQDTNLYIENYDKWVTENPPPSEFNPKNKRAWHLERTKLIWMLGIVLSAREDWLVKRGDFRDHVARHARRADGTPLHREEADSVKYYQKGIQAIEAKVDLKLGVSFHALKEYLLSVPRKCYGPTAAQALP